ncbi:MAG: hypothetical protein R6V47_01450 [Candidatus Delongbacteria bacterium]
MKKIVSLFVLTMLLVITSCSDESTKPETTDAQNVTAEMTGSVDQVMKSEGAVALDNNMDILNNLNFPSPVKNLKEALSSIERDESIRNFNPVKEMFSGTESTKQEEHFIFEDNLGTYECTDITTATDENGEEYVVDVQWDIVPGGNNITILIPADVALDEKKFEMVINDYDDQYIAGYGYPPTLMEMQISVDDTLVFDLVLNAQWEYIPAMTDIMPVSLTMSLGITPYDIQMDFSLTENEMNYDILVTENNDNLLDLTARILFTDQTFEEVEELEIHYTVDNYGIEMFANSAFIALTESADVTPQQIVDAVNAGEDVYLKIKEDGNVIGKLAAKIVEVTYGGQTYEEVELYVLFNDGSTMTQEEMDSLFEDMFGDIAV